jgi:hypothetical protein
LPTASPVPSEAPVPSSTFVPLASILSGPLPNTSRLEAAASISRLFAAHPSIATAFLNGSANLPLAEEAFDASCFSIQDLRTYEALAPQCLVSFQALWQAYRMSDDVAFMAAGAGVLGAMRQALPSKYFSRFELDLQGLSDFLGSQSRL